MERFCDYLLGSKFHVYMDNSPQAYVRESKLGASQIQWLSEPYMILPYTIELEGPTELLML